MKNNILNYLNKGRFEEILEYIIQDKKLSTEEKLLLIVLVNQGKKKMPDIKKIAEQTSLLPKKVEDTLDNLIEKKWCKKEIFNDNEKKTACYLQLPKKIKREESSLYNQKGSKIAKKWSNIFGTRQLTPTNLEKFTSYISDGIEEDVIIEVMKISAENAESNPVYYALNILNDYLKKGILSWEDFADERSERKEYERQVQKDNRAKEKRKELHNIKELEKRGWND